MALCSTPARTVVNFIDWACAGPADSTTAQRVMAAVTSELATLRHFARPTVRLLADTRDDGTVGEHEDATLIEFWDAADNGPALLAMINRRHGSDTLTVSRDDFGRPGDPAIISEAHIPQVRSLKNPLPNDEVVFGRPDLSAIEIVTATTTALTPISRVTSFTVPAEAFDGSGRDAHYSIQGISTEGTTPVSLPFRDLNSGQYPCGPSDNASTCVTYPGEAAAGPAAASTETIPNS